MAALNLSVKHGQTWDVAKANFEKGLARAGEKFGSYVRSVEWSDDRTSALVNGSGFNVRLWVDQEAVHAEGDVPFYVKFLEGSIRKFAQEALTAK